MKYFCLSIFLAMLVNCKEELTVENLMTGHHSDNTNDEEQLLRERRMLSKIVHEMDTDGDGLITLDNIIKHLSSTLKKLEAESANNAFALLKHNEPDFITLEEFLDDTFQMSEANIEKIEDDFLKKVIKKEVRRFKMADSDKDGRLSREEYQVFIYPDNYVQMQDLLTQEMFEDLDTNHDHLISEEEFIRSREQSHASNIEYHRDMFRKNDLNHDGFLDKNEANLWLHPSISESVKSQAKHLLEICDANKDGFLSEDEILSHIDSWRNHQATNYGSLLETPPKHDEL
ncbi:calcineurin inhibitor [Cichlidogyrus casuarinus]|uniref:Calcineurin inhibitor n=1 Tax=Cichlidogyrus casuarinus TaxID=1844966 RepID=A0ABD2QP16_9PLAT